MDKADGGCGGADDHGYTSVSSNVFLFRRRGFFVAVLQPKLTVDCRGSTRDGSTLLMEMESFLSEHPNLMTLIVGYSTMEQVPSAICNIFHLVTLNLDNNRLISLPRHCFRKSRGLQSFPAQQNSIAHLEDGVFAGIKDLGLIKLGENMLTDIPLRDFYNHKELQKLHHIDLSDNKLANLEPWPFIRSRVYGGSGQFYANLYHNDIVTFTTPSV